MCIGYYVVELPTVSEEKVLKNNLKLNFRFARHVVQVCIVVLFWASHQHQFMLKYALV